MKTVATVIALSALVALSPAKAEEINGIVGSANVIGSVPDVMVQDSEMFAIKGTFQYTHAQESVQIPLGENEFENVTMDGNGLGFGLAAAVPLSDTFQLSAGFATDARDFGDDYAIRLGLRWAPKRTVPVDNFSLK